MYGRSVGDEILNFEASGALQSASLVMRDRETDSWWSLMSSRAIGGDLEGSQLEELPNGQKVQWGDWRRMHPETKVLSVDGVEHVENSPYDNYFGGEGTFRGIEVPDDRLAPKQPIYAFWWDDTPQAVSHSHVEGGSSIPLGDGSQVLTVWREVGVSIFASTRAVITDSATTKGFESVSDLLAALDAGKLPEAKPASGFDTYWYTWVLVNPKTELLRP